jgi:hypothetical protein
VPVAAQHGHGFLMFASLTRTCISGDRALGIAANTAIFSLSWSDRRPRARISPENSLPGGRLDKKSDCAPNECSCSGIVSGTPTLSEGCGAVRECANTIGRAANRLHTPGARVSVSKLRRARKASGRYPPMQPKASETPAIAICIRRRGSHNRRASRSS